MPDQIEKVLSRLAHKDNLRMWGQLHVSRTGQTTGGWLVDSWSENGAPYWQCEMHWLDKKENKLYRAYIDFDRRSMNLHSVDAEIDPARAKFIRETVAQWEKEWFEAESKKL